MALMIRRLAPRLDVKVVSMTPYRVKRGLGDLTVLTEKNRKHLHQKSLELLESMGMKVYSDEVLRLLDKNGASVDFESKIARFPSSIVEEGLRLCKRPVRLGGRTPEEDFVFDLESHYLSTDGEGIAVLDFASGRRREPLLKDVEECARFADAIPELVAYTPIVTPSDVPVQAHTTFELAASVQNTKKHIVSGGVYRREEARAEIQIAEAVAGSAEELLKRPLFSSINCVSSPMIIGKTIEPALEYASAGIPPIIMTMPLVGASGPATIAGSALIGNAQVIAVNAVVQLAHPGSPVIYSSVPVSMDITTGAFGGALPLGNLVAAAHAQMAHHYSLPFFSGGHGSGSKVPDPQAAFEKALSAYTMFLAGADFLGGPGLLESFTVLSYEQFLIDVEMFKMMASMLEGFDVTEETLAEDLTKKVGHEGHYMGEKQTVDVLRRSWKPKLTDVTPYATWVANGSKDIVKRAHEEAERIMSSHVPDPLPESSRNRIRGILKEVERRKE
jgi:trimethylamine--corrinoid protein Co-methyltransferase